MWNKTLVKKHTSRHSKIMLSIRPHPLFMILFLSAHSLFFHATPPSSSLLPRRILSFSIFICNIKGRLAKLFLLPSRRTISNKSAYCLWFLTPKTSHKKYNDMSSFYTLFCCCTYLDAKAYKKVEL